MHILYVSQYFPPEACAPAVRVHELAREWIRSGHNVTVLTAFPHHPVGKKRPCDRGVLTRKETVDGITVVRTYVFATANQGSVKRMISYLSFMLSAIFIGWFRIKRPDVVIATSPQMLCGLGGYVLARLMRVPFVFEVRDLWPESIVAVEAMRENIVVRTLRHLAAFLYARSDRIVTVGEGYRRSIVKLYGTPVENIDVIPNGIDTSLFVVEPSPEEIRKQFGWEHKFVMMYIGTHGMAHDLSFVLEVARAMRNDPDKLFVFVGEGADKERLKSLASEWNLENVRFFDQQPRDQIPHFYAACHIGLVTLRNTSLFQEVLPSKIFEYLAMERPVLTTVDGEARRLIEAASAGEYVSPSSHEEMVNAIRRLAANPKDLAAMGQSGRNYVVNHFDRRVLAQRYLQVLSPFLKPVDSEQRNKRRHQLGDVRS